MKKQVSLVFLTIFLRALPGAAIQPESLSGLQTWQGQQFVQADRLGNIYFLNANRLTVYPLTKKDQFDEPEILEAASARPGTVYGAAMSLGGDRWVVHDARSARVFVDGKERPVPPLQWKPWSVTLLRDTPLVAVIPLPIGGRAMDLKKIGNPPWFLRLGKDAWESGLTLKGISVLELIEKDQLNAATAENAAFLMGDRQGKLWIARQYAYHVQRLTPGGRVLLDLTVDGGKIRSKPEKKPVEITLRREQDNPTDATRNPRQEKATYSAFSASPVLEALVEGRDGRIYFFVRTAEGGAALDRYDPARSILERVPLTVTLKNRPSLAAGRDGLYIAAWGGTDGRWRVSWETLEAARWQKVEGSRIDGFAQD
jgi:hypothetical protein